MKCLAKDPAGRYDSAREMAADLRAVIERRPIRARRPGFVELASRWVRQQQRRMALSGGAVAATILLMVLGYSLWNWNEQAKLGFVHLTTGTAPLTVEVVDVQGARQEPPETLPMQESLALPAGDIRLRVTGEGAWSQNYRAHLGRGEVIRQSVRVDDQLAAAPIDIEGSYRLAPRSGRVDVLEMHDKGLRLRNVVDGKVIWQRTLQAEDDEELKQATLRWPWTIANWRSGMGKYDTRPFLVGQIDETPGAPRRKHAMFDLNGDGEADLILAARHQAWLLAISGKDGKTLWIAPRGRDAQPEPDPKDKKKKRRTYRAPGVFSACLYEPSPVGDVNDDGIDDFAAVFADVGLPNASSPPPHLRWLEVFSGADGAPLWRWDTPPAWLQTPTGGSDSEHYRWFYGGFGGGSSSNFSHISAGGTFALRPYRRRLNRSGRYLVVPGEPRMIRVATEGGDRSAGTQRLAVLVRNRVVMIDPKNGDFETSPALQLDPDLPARWSDLDGDGLEDVLLIEDSTKANAFGNIPPKTDFAAWSPSQGALLWRRTLDVFWPRRARWQMPYPNWPLLEDLDGDGAKEVITPQATTFLRFGQSRIPPSGEVAVLDGASGETKWTRRIRALDQQIECITVGPDIDEDGHREVFAACLWSAEIDLYVNCLSGKTGDVMWWNSHPLRTPEYHNGDFFLGPLYWWNGRADGWPQLMTVAYGNTGSRFLTLHNSFSAANGEHLHMGRRLHLVTPADTNGDGVDELVAFESSNYPRSFDHGGRLQIVQGVAGEPWRFLGKQWSPVGDLNGDGVRDLVGLAKNRLLAHSGVDASLIWDVPSPEPRQHEMTIVPCGASPIRAETFRASDRDLDADGVPDLLLFVKHFDQQQRSPLHAVSGRTGRLLWSCAELVQVSRAAPLLETRDLDGDGRAEVVMTAAVDWGLGRRLSLNFNDQPLWLAVLSGRDGGIRWRKMLANSQGGLPSARNYDFDQETIAPPYGDLNGDGVLDLVVPAESSAALGEWSERAFDGRTGRELWSRKTPGFNNNDRTPLTASPPVAIGDLDGDKNPEAVLAFFQNKQTNRGSAREMIVEAVTSGEGQPLWKWTTDVALNFGRWINNRLDRINRARPVLLRTKGGAALVAIPVGRRNSAEIVVLDAKGSEVRQIPLNRINMNRRSWKLWPIDIDRDGDDEIFVHNGMDLTVFDAESGEAIWTRPFSTEHASTILGVTQGSADNVPVAYCHAGGRFGGAAVEAVSVADGSLLWSCPGPSPLKNNSFLRMDAVRLLGAMREGPPLVYFQYGSVSLCRAASLSTQPVSLTRAAARTDGGPHDPRWTRPLPWNPDMSARDWSQMVGGVVWSLVASVSMVIVPGGFLWFLIARRTFGMRALMVAPIVVALFMFAAVMQPPEGMRVSFMTRWVAALFGAPAVLFMMCMIGWAVRRRWRIFFGYSGLVLAVSACVGLMAIYVPLAFGSGAWLAPGERYSWDGWYLILFAGVYGAGYILMFAFPIWKMIRWSARQWRTGYTARDKHRAVAVGTDE